MKKHKFFIYTLFLALVSCSKSGNQCRLQGNLEDCPDSTILYLVNDESGNIIDSIVVRNGVFKIDLALSHPQQFTIHNKRNLYKFRDRKTLWLEASDIEIKGSYEFLSNVEVSGSVSNNEYNEYKILREEHKESINRIVGFQRRIIKVDEESDDYLMSELDSIRNIILSDIQAFIELNSDSYVGLLALSDLNKILGRYGQSQIKELYQQLPDHLRSTKKGKIILRATTLPKIPRTGDKFIDIVQPNQYGDTIKLSDFLGTYILVDFWASWCGPCRAANPFLREIHNKYKKGFTVYGVSGDVSKESWINAINVDSLTWPNVSDLGGWNNAAFEVYGIRGVPSQVLIDPNGIIIGRNYCSSELNMALDSIFSNN